MTLKQGWGNVSPPKYSFDIPFHPWLGLRGTGEQNTGLKRRLEDKAGPITSYVAHKRERYRGMIIADADNSHEIKRHLLNGRKAMTNLDSILKSRDITLATKVRIVKAMVFPGLMYGSESWTIKKADRQRIDAFELWCWRRLLRVPWTARRTNLSKGNQP